MTVPSALHIPSVHSLPSSISSINPVAGSQHWIAGLKLRAFTQVPFPWQESLVQALESSQSALVWHLMVTLAENTLMGSIFWVFSSRISVLDAIIPIVKVPMAPGGTSTTKVPTYLVVPSSVTGPTSTVAPYR